MRKLIDADALYMELVKMKDFGELTAKKAIRVVKNAPTIDAVPVIRCKDCAHYDIAENGVNGICRKLIAPFDAYEWCSRSDPREEKE